MRGKKEMPPHAFSARHLCMRGSRSGRHTHAHTDTWPVQLCCIVCVIRISEECSKVSEEFFRIWRIQGILRVPGVSALRGWLGHRQCDTNPGVADTSNNLRFLQDRWETRTICLGTRHESLGDYGFSPLRHEYKTSISRWAHRLWKANLLHHNAERLNKKQGGYTW